MRSRVLRAALRGDGRAQLWLWLTIGAGAVAAAAAVGHGVLLARAIAAVFPGQGGGPVPGFILASSACVLALAAALWAGEVFGQRLAGRVRLALRDRLAAHLLALGPAYVEGERSGELAAVAVDGVESLDEYLSQYLPQVTLAAVAPAIVLAAVLLLDPLSALVLLLTAPLIPLFMWLIGTHAAGLAAQRWRELGWMSAHLLDMLQGLPTLKLFGRSRERAAEVAAVSARFGDLTMEVLRVAFLSAMTLELVASLSTAVLAVTIALRLLAGELAFAPALAVLILAPEFYQPLRALGQRRHAAMAGEEALGRIAAILETPAPTPARPHSCAPPRSPDGGAIVFEGVRFAYDGGARPALCGVDLRVEAGETVAIVGPNGAGKSTLGRLLLGFDRPDAGTVSAGGANLAALDPAAWRRRVAWVGQRPALFAGSVAANLRLARPDATDAELESAARAAGAHEFVAALPLGYATPVGPGGARLSGGERRRLAVARALLKDAPLVILDEPTAHLDAASEAAVQAGLRRTLEGRTAVLITHNPALLACAHRVVRLEAGRVVMGDGGSPRPPIPGGPRAEPRPACSTDCREGPSQPAPVMPRPPSGSLTPARRLLALAAPYRGAFALAALLGFATVGSSVGLTATSSYLIARAALMPPIAALNVAIVGVRFFGIARALLRYAERYVAHRATFRLLAGVRGWFFAAVEPLAPAGLVDTRGGDLLARAVGDVETLEQLYLRVLSPPLVALLTAALTGALLAAFDARVALAVLCLQLLAGAGLPLLARRLARRPAAEAAAARAELTATAVEALQGLPDLLALGAEDALRARLAGQGRRLAAAQQRQANLRGLSAALTGALGRLAAVAAVVLAVPAVGAGELDGVFLALLALTAMASFEAVAPLAGAVQGAEASLAAARRLFAVTDTPPPVGDEPAASPAPRDASVEIAGLSFRYPGAARPVLRDVCARVGGGERLLVLGPSGAGKSTLAALLLRFWDGYAGSIKVGGHDLRAYRADDVRRLFGVVAQDTHLFNGTVRENLLLARPGAAGAELDAVCRRARFDAVLARLPEGYDTRLGEGGAALSGGERQRLAIARALLKDAPILLLDEPTAHLDADAEREVLAALKELERGRTTILISHRPAASDGADAVLRLP
jgi:ATP-binding cassette subfamily C protein CydCD